MSIVKTPFFWVSISGIGLIGTCVAYVLSIETFGDKLGSSCCILPAEEDKVGENAFSTKENRILNQKSSSDKSLSLDTLIKNTENKKSYGNDKEFLPLKNGCISRYKDTYSSLFQKPKQKELEEIKEFCAS